MSDHNARMAYYRDFQAQAEDCARHLNCSLRGLKTWLSMHDVEGATNERIARYLAFQHGESFMEVHWMEPDFDAPFAHPTYLDTMDPREPFTPRIDTSMSEGRRSSRPSREERLEVEGNLFAGMTNESRHADRG